MTSACGGFCRAPFALPNMKPPGPPTICGVTYSPIVGMNTKMNPATTPGNDNGTVAPGQYTSEFGVTIAMQDSSGPFDWHLTRELIRICQEHRIVHSRDDDDPVKPFVGPRLDQQRGGTR